MNSGPGRGTNLCSTKGNMISFETPSAFNKAFRGFYSLT